MATHSNGGGRDRQQLRHLQRLRPGQLGRAAPARGELRVGHAVLQGFRQRAAEGRAGRAGRSPGYRRSRAACRSTSSLATDVANIGQPNQRPEPGERRRRVRLPAQPERSRPGQLHRPDRLRAAGRSSRFGDTPRNYLRGPKFSSTDVSFMKLVQLGGNRRIQLRAEVFNIFNQVNWLAPGLTLGTASFGVISSAETMRRAELGVKFLF